MSVYYIIAFISLLTVVTPQHATICDEARLYTFIPDVRDCSAWFFCGLQGPIRGICSNQLLFNPKTGLCDWPHNVDCFKCPSNIGFHTIPMIGSCRSFVRCINGNPFQSICEHGLHFNENTGQCDLTDVVRCTSGYRCPYEIPADGIIAMRDNFNCSVYHLCAGDSEAVRQECNPELHFDPITNLCTYPNLTSCPIKQSPEGPGIGPEPDAMIAPLALMASPTTKDGSTEFTTTELETEEPTTEVETEQPTTELENEEPTEAPTEMPIEALTEMAQSPTDYIDEFECPFDGIHPHPTECTEYFICAVTVPHLMRCADGLHFNAATLQCDFPENAYCDLYNNSI